MIVNEIAKKNRFKLKTRKQKDRFGKSDDFLF